MAIGLGQSVTARVRLAVVFCAWFLLVTVLAATDALHYQHGIGILGLGATVVLPIAILFITGLRSAPAQQALLAIPLWLLIGVNSIRVLGVYFVILHAGGRLPAPFAPTAGWGDIIVGLTAGPLAWFAFRRMSMARPAIWIWNAFGLVDLIAAIGLGVTSSPGPLRLIFAEPGTSLMTTLPVVADSRISCSLTGLDTPCHFLPPRQGSDSGRPRLGQESYTSSGLIARRRCRTKTNKLQSPKSWNRACVPTP